MFISSKPDATRPLEMPPREGRGCDAREGRDCDVMDATTCFMISVGGTTMGGEVSIGTGREDLRVLEAVWLLVNRPSLFFRIYISAKSSFTF